MACCRDCGYAAGHHRFGCPRARKPKALRKSFAPPRPPTSAASIADTIHGALDGDEYNAAGSAEAWDQSAVEVRVDGGVWRITVERVG